jgi:murein DD-endopeptidase MepM/ murein hydrolase activator NlpD
MKKICIILSIITGFSLLSRSTAYAQICTPDQMLEPTKTCSPSPGFPGSSTPIQLHEAGIVQQRPEVYFPLIPAPFSGPYVPGSPGDPGNPNPPELPCPGDMIKNPTLASSGASGYKGGTYGFTRTNGTQFHDGTDIKAAPGTPIYSTNNGIVTDFRKDFAVDQYRAKSYGNYVQITYVENGTTVTLKFNHLNGVSGTLVKGGPVAVGQLLGYSGRTGNAADPPAKKSDVIPHVHIQARENGKKVDPEKYLKSNFDKTTGKPSKSPC